MVDKGRTIVQNPAFAGSVAAEKRAQGYKVTIKSIGSDSKRGTRPAFVIEWTR